MVIATHTSTFDNPDSASSGQHQETGGDAQPGDHHEQQDDIPPPPPPPESLTMALFHQALQEERQANNAAIQQLAQVLVNNPLELMLTFRCILSVCDGLCRGPEHLCMPCAT